MLSALGGDQAEIKATINEVLHSYSPPRIAVPPDRALTRLAPFRVELDSIPEPYSHEFRLSCGSIREALLTAKQKLYYAMFDVDDIMENYEQVVDESDPKRFLAGFRDKLRQDYPFFQSHGWKAIDADRAIEYLEDGLREFEELQTGLRAVGRWEWAVSLLASVSELEPDIKSFLQHVEADEFTLYWPVTSMGSKPALRLECGKPETTSITFITKHTRCIEPCGEDNRKPITVSDVASQLQRRITEHLWTLVRTTNGEARAV